MSRIEFSKIATRYEDYSLVQKSAANVLLEYLKIRNTDDVLDLGCGVGGMTRKIKGITKGKVVGIDPSDGMINKATEKNKGLNISFETRSAEKMDYKDCFDVIFCNSAFQWFKDPEKAVRNCYKALRNGGRMGLQAPAKKEYSPNFIEAIKKVKENPKTGGIFAHFKNPWFFLETSNEYKNLFEDVGFKVIISKINRVKTNHTPEEVFNIFSSGAIAGYLSQEFYNVKIDRNYVNTFKKIVKNTFVQQVNKKGNVELIFNRIFLVAIKE